MCRISGATGGVADLMSITASSIFRTVKQQNCMIMTRDGNDIEQNEDPRFDRFRFHYTKKTQEPEKFEKKVRNFFEN